MKIIIPIKRVLDPYTQARVNKQTQLVDLTNAKMAMNPFCEIAVEEALKIKESGAASETIAVSIGTEKTIDTLRTALAMGVDRAIFVNTESALDLQPPCRHQSACLGRRAATTGSRRPADEAR